MKGQSGNINGNGPKDNSWDNPDFDIQVSGEDSALFENISDYMTARFDLDEVRNDKSLKEIENEVNQLISDYSHGNKMNRENERFIKDNFRRAEYERNIPKEIRNIKFEIHKSNVDVLTADWVKDWHERKRKEVLGNRHDDEIRNFVTSSLETEKSKPELAVEDKKVKLPRRAALIGYISLSAAAVITVLILIRTFLPSSDPEKIYSSYYSPFNAMSSVTRGGNTNGTDVYSGAIAAFRNGNYQQASAGFSVALRNEPEAVEPRFFMGITQMALGNYDQAVDLLESISGKEGNYRKEASWYLGLCYIKTGKKEKATDCFNLLAQTPGFYSERSAKILRRLK